MSKRSNSEQRLTDAVDCSVGLARVATGEDQDVGYVPNKRRNSGVADTEARMWKTSAELRSRIAAHAAKSRRKKEAKMNDHIGGALALLYEEKRKQGLVDTKFLHKNLDEGSPAQVEADLLKIQRAILAGSTTPLDFGDLRWKKAH